jgi:hypothetical protein
MPNDPAGINPLILESALDRVAAQHGVQFVGTTKAFAAAKSFVSLYYLTDGHPKDEGHAVMAEVVEQGLLSEPEFGVCRKLSAR